MFYFMKKFKMVCSQELLKGKCQHRRIFSYIAKKEQLERLDDYLTRKVIEVPNVEKLLAIKGVEFSTVTGL